MIFQHFNLLSSRTVHGNVALPLELAGVRCRGDQAARRPNCWSWSDWPTLRDRYPAQISGGQKQRVGIARALANRPKVLLSDEATSALDPETTRSILGLLRQINREFGLTIVLITHQMQVIKQVADRVAVIDAGRIVEQGPVIDVFTRPQQATTRSLIVDDRAAGTARERAGAHPRPDGERAGARGQLLRLAFAGDESTGRCCRT